MLHLERRVVLEDHLGEKHAHFLLETIDDRYFVLLPPAAAEEVARLQTLDGDGLDEALDILALGVAVLGVRDHRFLLTRDVPAVLARSRHHALVLAGMRMGALPEGLRDEELSPVAFMNECRKRMSW